MYHKILEIEGLGRSVSWPLYYRVAVGQDPYGEIARELGFDRRQFDEDPDFQTSRIYATLLLAGRAVVHTLQLAELGVTSVTEWAAGFGGRGLEMVRANPDLVYCEVDREPRIVDAKEALIDYLAPDLVNLHIFQGDVLNWDEVERATRPLVREGHHGLVSEGLLAYYGSDSDFYRILANAYRLLSQFPYGTWVTNDVLTRQHGNHIRNRFPAVQAAKERILGTTGIDMYAHCFESHAAAEAAFRSQGLEPSRRPMTDYLPAMSAILHSLQIDAAEAATYLDFVDVYSLTPIR